MKNKQLDNIWKAEFGDQYTDRMLKVHEGEGGQRKKFWDYIINAMDDVKSVTEIGCNAGMNLEGIHSANQNLKIIGIEPNHYAREKALFISKNRYSVVEGNIFNLSGFDKSDLGITCTLLIHIAPENLIKAMKNVYELSKKYILIMEYYWPTLKEIHYRGLDDALWKQDFGRIFTNNFDVDILKTGYLDERDGFDGVTWWLFKKR
tara:strand:+ start:293 stop:907 length:615 start_codon:yes stop_codon:yes gene_type:complete